MAEDIAREDIKNILARLNRKFEVQFVKWQDSKIFEAKIKTQIPQDNEDFSALCDEWVDKFSEVTDTIWAKKTSNTGPKIRFRKQYQCWTGEGKIIKTELLFDRTRCKGSLDLKVLSDNPLSKRKNKNVRLGLNLAVKMTFHHLHQVDTAQPSAFLVHRCSPQQDVPRVPIQPNARLPELVAAVVQKGPEISRKAAEKAEKIMAKLNHTNQTALDCEATAASNNKQLNVEVIGDPSPDTVESIKLETYLSDPQYTQFIVNTPQFDFSDQVFMYQPLVLDVPQLISLTAHSSAPQFLQVQARADGQTQGGQIL
ncbi:unnamed protein product [Phyllotreta striolata]|uniref:Uncharacterized protein n=1 Tax=Phyllotreta striolata TaxID=444603 RepID=A0A9N9U115_PHYSR|nr:unnamed protein product [Phyllotreta striolata]